MSVQLLPDIEAIAVEHLAGHLDVDALCDGRVYTEVPEGPTYPFLTVLRIAGRPRPQPRWLDQAQLQIMAWTESDGREAARDLCETAVAALHELLGETSFGVVTGVEDILGPRSLPDPETSWPRFEAEVLITAHPGPQGS